MKREELIQAINQRFREMSTETIMLHQAVADTLGLHITDHKCMDFLYRFGPMPAGKLANLTGLTTGAVTGVIDRLEKAGYVKRVSDLNDRRRTIVEPARDKKLRKKLELIFAPLSRRMNTVLSSYTDNELGLLLDATTSMLNQAHEETTRLRAIGSRRLPRL